MLSDQKNIFIFGLGYCGLAFAKACLDQGWQVSGTYRRDHQKALLQQLGIETIYFAGTDAIEIPAATTHLLSTIAPDPTMTDPVTHLHSKQLTDLPKFTWCAYLSATSVYGDWEGAWVDENAELKATSSKSKLRIKAEKYWQALDLPLNIFRLAGIYGPERNLVSRLKRNKVQRVIKPGHVFSRIHIDDITQILLTSIKLKMSHEIFNCADDYPCPMSKVIEYICDKHSIPLPPPLNFDNADLSPMAKSFYSDSRRIYNKKLKSLLNIDLLHPNFHNYYENP